MTLFATKGAGYQAQAVLAYLGSHDGVEPSWSDVGKFYEARVTCGEWHNCRERGYVISMRAAGVQINIAFFEHRNSDEICAVVWEQNTLNPPTIDTADFGGAVYHDKYDVSHSEPYGHAGQMAAWIMKRLEQHWMDKAKAAA